MSYTLLDADAAAGCDAYPTASLADSLLGLTVEIDPWGVVEQEGDPTADDHLERRTADELIAWAAVPDLDPNRWHVLHIRIDALRIRIPLDGALVMDTVLPSADLLPARAGQLFQAFTGDLPNVHGIRAVRIHACADGLPWDNCPDVDTPDQLDSDYDGLGDACDPE